MAETKIVAKICLRQGDNAYCESFDGTVGHLLLTGEPIFNTSTKILKIGDGASAYNQLDSYYLGTEITGVAYNNGNLTITKKDSNGGDFGFSTRIVNITKDQLANALKIELTNKANTSDVNTALAAKADKTYVDEELDTKANSVDVNASINDANFSNGKLTLKKLDNTNKEISINNFGETDVTITGKFQQGTNTSVTGNYAHAEGLSNIANGNYSHTEGHANTANGNYSHAEGENTLAQRYASHAEGFHTITSADYQHVSGKYNADNSDALLIVGNGTDDSHRSNALEVFQDGKVKIGANPEEPMEVTTKEYVDTSVQDAYLTKTLSGESIYIEDGANNVPVKALSATVTVTSGTLPVTLTLKKMGKNLFSATNTLIYGKTISAVSGNILSSSSYCVVPEYIQVLPGTTYSFSLAWPESYGYYLQVRFYSLDKSYLSGKSSPVDSTLTFKTPAECYWVRFIVPQWCHSKYWNNPKEGDIGTFRSEYKPQLELGAESIYEAYTEQDYSITVTELNTPTELSASVITRLGENVFQLQRIDGVTATMSMTYYCDPTYAYEKNLNLILSAYPAETQSGESILHTNIGADDVSLKSASVTVTEGSGMVTLRCMGKNLFNPNTEFVNGKRIEEDGTELENKFCAITKDYIPVQPNTTYSLSGAASPLTQVSVLISYYTSEKVFIVRQSQGKEIDPIFTTPSNCHFIRFSVAAIRYRNGKIAFNYVRDNIQYYQPVQLEIGTAATAYTPYFAQDATIEVDGAGTYALDSLPSTALGDNTFLLLPGAGITATFNVTYRCDPTLAYEKLKAAIIAAGTT